MTEEVATSKAASSRLRWRVAAGVLAVLALWAMVFCYVDRRAPSAAAQAMLMPAPDLPGRNAFPAVWLLQMDVPPEQLETVAAADMADLAQRTTSEPWVAPSRKRFAWDVFRALEQPGWCDAHTADCWQAVRADPQAHAAQVDQYSAMWPRVVAMAQYQRLQWPAQNHGTQVPLDDAWRNAITAHAVALVQSPSTQGVRQLCRHLATTRRLAEHDGRNWHWQDMATNQLRHGLQLLAHAAQHLPQLTPSDWVDCTMAFAANPQWPQQVCNMAKYAVQANAGKLRHQMTGMLAADDGDRATGFMQTLVWLFAGRLELMANAEAEMAAQACTPAFAAAVLAGQLPEPERRGLLQRALLAARAPAASALNLYREPDYMAPAAKLVADREAVAMAGRTWLWWHAQLQREGVSGSLATAMKQGGRELDAVLASRLAPLHMAGRSLRVAQHDGQAALVLALLPTPANLDGSPRDNKALREVTVLLPRLP